jgi:hypothetical protein
VSVASPITRRGSKATITHGKTKSSARDVAAVVYVSIWQRKAVCRSAAAVVICEHGSGSSMQRIAAAVLYEHMWQAEGSVQCSGSGICEHGRQKLSAEVRRQQCYM